MNKKLIVWTAGTVSILLSMAVRAQSKTSLKSNPPVPKKTEYYLGGTVVDGQADDILKSRCASEEFLPILKLETKKDVPSETLLTFKMPGSSDTIKMTISSEQVRMFKIRKGMRLCALDDNENRD